MNLKIVHHHVGARGSVALPLPKDSPLRDDFHLVYCDADATAVNAQLRQTLAAGEITLLPYCIGEVAGARDFNVAKVGTNSSLYRANARYGAFTQSLGGTGDLHWGDSHRTVRQVSVEVRPLDAVCPPGSDVPPPDYLSIDAEGSELPILLGAAGLLASSVLWVRTEVWIHPVYDGAPTMAETLTHMEQAGFDFVDLEKYDGFYPTTMPLGLHGNGLMLGADVTFARRLETLSETGEGQIPVIAQLYKLAYLALLFSKFGVCKLSLNRAAALGGRFFMDDNKIFPARYLGLLWRVAAILEQYDREMPLIPDLLGFQDHRRPLAFRYNQATDGGERAAIKSELRQSALAMQQEHAATMNEIEKVGAAEQAPLEQLLRRHGLTQQADLLRQRRQALSQQVVEKYRFILSQAGLW